MATRLTGAQMIVAVDGDPERLALARELGATPETAARLGMGALERRAAAVSEARCTKLGHADDGRRASSAGWAVSPGPLRRRSMVAYPNWAWAVQVGLTARWHESKASKKCDWASSKRSAVVASRPTAGAQALMASPRRGR